MTTLFADGFESGNTDAWTLETANNGGTITVQGTTKRVGAYALKSSSDGTALSQAYVERAVSEQGDIYWRIYVMFSALPAVNLDKIGFLSIFNNVNRGILNLSIYNQAGSVRWRMYYYNGAWIGKSSAVSPVANVWYCVEVYGHIAAVGGSFTVWVNEGEGITETGIADLNAHGLCDRISMGIDDMDGSLIAVDVYVDECRGGDLRVTCRLGDVTVQREIYLYSPL